MLLIKNAEINGYLGQATIRDVRCNTESIIAIDHTLKAESGEQIVDANGGALLPGLHDHHIHLYALAAVQSSVDCGPEQFHNHEQFKSTLLQQSGNSWIRGINYHESVAGDLDRWQLDALIPNIPVRIQHRSGILWVLNSCAIDTLGLENEDMAGLERNSEGQLTGRLYRLDHWLRNKMKTQQAPSLFSLSRQLADYGITGLTDTGADNDAEALSLFQKAIDCGDLLQDIVVMGSNAMPAVNQKKIRSGTLKILLDDFQLPQLDKLITQINQAHKKNRPVAFHCVTETQLIYALSAIREAGPLSGDRIEHASICPDNALPLIRETGVAVVTQPGLLANRGLQYQNDVPPEHHPLLYRCKVFLDQHIPFALSSDAPYGEVNPWHNMQAAIDRSNTQGYIFGENEKLSPEQALQSYLGNPVDLTKERKIVIGEKANFCLLRKNWQTTRKRLADADIHKTIIDGNILSN